MKIEKLTTHDPCYLLFGATVTLLLEHALMLITVDFQSQSSSASVGWGPSDFNISIHTHRLT